MKKKKQANDNIYVLSRKSTLVLSEIMLLEADINYTTFNLSTGKKIVSSYTLKRFEKDFPKSDFLRINKSMMLNKAFIKSIDKNQVVLKNERVSVSFSPSIIFCISQLLIFKHIN